MTVKTVPVIGAVKYFLMISLRYWHDVLLSPLVSPNVAQQRSKNRN